MIDRRLAVHWKEQDMFLIFLFAVQFLGLWIILYLVDKEEASNTTRVAVTVAVMWGCNILIDKLLVKHLNMYINLALWFVVNGIIIGYSFTLTIKKAAIVIIAYGAYLFGVTLLLIKLFQ